MKDLIEHLEASGLHPMVIDENTVFPSQQSNFLPGTNIQFAWDSTTLGAFKPCARLYQYQYIDGWVSNEESIHLRFGIEYHQALHDYELAKANGNNHDDAMQLALGDLTQRLETYPETDPTAKASIKNKSRANLMRTVVWYLDKFADDPAETVILDDGKPALEVSFKFELDWGPKANESCPPGGWKHEMKDGIGMQPYLLCGHLDRIVRYNSE